MKNKSLAKLLRVLSSAAIAFAIVVLPVYTAQASSTVVITEDQIVRQPMNTFPTNNWVLFTRDAGDGAFRSGPDTPPAPIGSVEFTTPGGNDKAYLFNYDYISTPLSAIDAIEYATYRTAGSLQQVTSLNIEVDFNGPDVTGGFTTLVFEPVYNTSQGPVISGQWQTWDAFNGGAAVWWSTKTIPGVCSFDCFVSWNTILASNPAAVILGGFGLNQGGGNATLVAAVDTLAIGVSGDTTTYNFEPFIVAQTEEQCMNNGWQVVKRADGSSFKNQGDCIQYVNTGK